MENKRSKREEFSEFFECAPGAVEEKLNQLWSAWVIEADKVPGHDVSMDETGRVTIQISGIADG